MPGRPFTADDHRKHADVLAKIALAWEAIGLRDVAEIYVGMAAVHQLLALFLDREVAEEITALGASFAATIRAITDNEAPPG